MEFAGFEDTVLFRQVSGSAHVDQGMTYPLGPEDPPVEVVLRLVPSRCDPHALAEDKVGTLVPVRVMGADLPPAAAFYLPIGTIEGIRGALAMVDAAPAWDSPPSHCPRPR